ncbi:ABC transporter permease [Afifella pfennigii]|uniref:ABC transporter permease n=1 Tax=Afifella pfennigii TaxID=209897 RepID=UPI0004788613|nr:ABC transporter permease [Afifella pfennigii]
MAELFGLLSFGPEGWGDELLAGLGVTVALALVTLPIGLVLGFLLALAKDSGERSLVTSATILTTIFRGLPELLTLFIIYYGGQIALQQLFRLLFDRYIEFSAFTAGVIALSLVFASFASEVFLSAFRGIQKGQYEGAHALGLRPAATMRLVILPQLVRLALPGLSNLWLILLKDTSLVSVIALNDLLRNTNIAVGVTKEPFFFYAVACLIYLALSILSSFGIGGIDRWARRGEAAR